MWLWHGTLLGVRYHTSIPVASPFPSHSPKVAHSVPRRLRSSPSVQPICLVGTCGSKLSLCVCCTFTTLHHRAKHAHHTLGAAVDAATSLAHGQGHHAPPSRQARPRLSTARCQCRCIACTPPRPYTQFMCTSHDESRLQPFCPRAESRLRLASGHVLTEPARADPLRARVASGGRAVTRLRWLSSDAPPLAKQ